MSPNTGADVEPEATPTPGPVAVTPAKKGLPNSVSALVIVAFLVVVYFVYQKMTAERPIQMLPGSAKAGQSKAGGGGAPEGGGGAPHAAPPAKGAAPPAGEAGKPPPSGTNGG